MQFWIWSEDVFSPLILVKILLSERGVSLEEKRWVGGGVIEKLDEILVNDISLVDFGIDLDHTHDDGVVDVLFD